MSADDPYVYPGTDVLKNKFHLRNDRSLGRRERIESSLALKQLGQSPVTGAFDLKHYQDIHRRLFEKVYDWAGQVRTVDLTKPEIALRGQTVQYSPIARIEADATRAVGLLAGPWGDLKDRPEAARFAVVVSELWRAHPFREGNTRTVLAFVEQFTRAHDIRLDMTVINRVPSETRDALALATTGHIAPLVRLIVEARRSELQRAHPELGRLTSEAVEVVRLLGNPRIVVPTVGQEVRGQVLTTSYDHVLVRQAGAIAAVPLRAFTKPPPNDMRVAVTVQPPGMQPTPAPGPVRAPQRQPEAVLAERPIPVPLDAPAPQRQPDAVLNERPIPVPLDAPAPQRQPDAVLTERPTPAPLDAPAPQRQPDAVLAERPIPVPLDAPAPQRQPDAVLNERPTPAPLDAPAPQRQPDAVLAERPTPAPLDAPAPQRQPDTGLTERPIPAPLDAPAPQRQPDAVLTERPMPVPLAPSAQPAQPEFLIPPRIAQPFPPEAIDEYLAGNPSARQARAEAVTVVANVFKSPEAIVRTFEQQIARGQTFDSTAFANEPMRGTVTWHGNDRERTAALRHLPTATDIMRRLESALRAAMAAQRAHLERHAQRDRIPIPAPSPRLADALATAVEIKSVQHVLADPELMTEVKGLTTALHARFEHEGTAVLTLGRSDDAAALLPEGGSVEAVRAVLEPLRAVVMAEQEQARTLTREKTLAPEAPTLGASR